MQWEAQLPSDSGVREAGKYSKHLHTTDYKTWVKIIIILVYILPYKIEFLVGLFDKKDKNFPVMLKSLLQ